MTFEEAVKLNDLEQTIDAQYGQWGHFSQAAADVIWEAASKETQPYFRISLAAMLAVTMMNESTFRLDVAPNINKQPLCPTAWDFGPCQINFFWNVLEAWEGNVTMKGLGWRDVFGCPPYKPDEAFTGNAIANTRACARIMLSKPTLSSDAIPNVQETHVVHYTGGDEERKAHRRADWRKYSELFMQFFEAYK